MRKDIDIFEHRSAMDYLKNLYHSIHQSNPRFSYRSFAVKLGMDQSMLTRYFKGVRFLAAERIDDISKRLELTEVESQYFKLIGLFGDRGDFYLVDVFRDHFVESKKS